MNGTTHTNKQTHGNDVVALEWNGKEKARREEKNKQKHVVVIYIFWRKRNKWKKKAIKDKLKTK